MDQDATNINFNDSTAYELPSADEKEALKVAQEALQYRLFNKALVTLIEFTFSRFTCKTNFGDMHGYK